MFTDNVTTAAQAHALDCYPEESCGLVVRGRYIKCTNAAADISTHVEGNPDCRCRLCSFVVDTKSHLKYEGKIEAVVHSHPGGPHVPSAADMASQIAMGVPWGLLAVDDERVSDIRWFGDGVPREPLIGRQFVHGVTDCYALIRDTFAMGADELRRQGITSEWPFPPVALAEVPRNDNWWANGDDLYADGFGPFGFEPVSPAEVMPGDVFLCRVPRVVDGHLVRDRLNHGGMYIGEHLILDHQVNRLSGRQPLNVWARAAELWIRYTRPIDDAHDSPARAP